MQERTEYVSREGILADIQEDIDFKSLTLTEDANNRMNDGLRLAQRRIRNYPAANVRPVVRAHYITDEWGDSSCSECGEPYLDITKNFCPNCGAEMRNTATLEDAAQDADAGAMSPAT